MGSPARPPGPTTTSRQADHFAGHDQGFVNRQRPLLASGQLANAVEQLHGYRALNVDSVPTQNGHQRPGPGMLAHDELGRGLAHVSGMNQLEAVAVLVEGRAVNARFVEKTGRADDRFGGGYGSARCICDHAAEQSQAMRVDTWVEFEGHPCRHHDFVKAGVAGALAEPVHCDVDRACTARQRPQRVRRGHAQIVVGMKANDRSPCACHHMRHETPGLKGIEKTDGIS